MPRIIYDLYIFVHILLNVYYYTMFFFTFLGFTFLKTKHVDCILNKLDFLDVSSAISDFISANKQFLKNVLYIFLLTFYILPIACKKSLLLMMNRICRNVLISVMYTFEGDVRCWQGTPRGGTRAQSSDCDGSRFANKILHLYDLYLQGDEAPVLSRSDPESLLFSRTVN